MWWQEGIESQAIDRCNRIGRSVCPSRGSLEQPVFASIGQTKPVHVYQLIAENTVESKVGNEDWHYDCPLVTFPYPRFKRYKIRRKISSRRHFLV
jgi:hypothetical protein